MSQRVPRFVIEKEFQFAPVTLPFGFRKLQKYSCDIDFSAIGQIEQDSADFLSELEARRARRIEAYERWLEKAQQHTLSIQRAVAPGYLDSNAHLLVPTPVKHKEAVGDALRSDPEAPKQLPPQPLDDCYGGLAKFE